MKLRTTLLVAAATTLVAAAPAAASPQQTLTFDTTTAGWTGPTANGANTSWFLDSFTGAGTCANTDEASRCDSTVVFLDFPAGTPFTGSTLKVRMDGFRQVDDFDLRVYDLGTKPTGAGTYLGSPTGTDIGDTSPLGSDDPRYTFFGDFEYKHVTGLKAGRFYRVDVVYFGVANGNYKGTVTLDKPPVKPVTAE